MGIEMEYNTADLNLEVEYLHRSTSGNRHRKPSGDAAETDEGGGSEDGKGPSLRKGSSFRRGMEHAAAETYLITRLTFTLLQYLGLGYRWISKLLALGMYAILLMPGFVQVGYYYFFSSQVRRSVVYGPQPRNRLDLYLPKDCNGSNPVVAFVTGGAWIIGYKAWGSLLGKRLAERGVIVACIDYRNFPQGTIGDMVRDASQGISFVCNNIAVYGGNPKQIFLMGQSAGAHISACALMDQAVKEANGERISWSVSQIKTYFGLSGGYNLPELVDHFNERGLSRRIFLSIMEGEQGLHHFSPEIVAKESSAKAVSLLPPIILFHGTEDYSIPSSASENFAKVLENSGVQVRLVLYEGKTHTDLFLQDPLRGGRDELVEDVVATINNSVGTNIVGPTPRRLVPEWQLQLARRISPF
ncbi:putative isoprenylcysteine alpha-carbonyl methylesterase ICMEL2 isoform X1 [Carex littledalei]|uniref:protein-S-isoprenylcysteine alpha-carbonyl methylesterase n=1 Tax=Carex littledalei TaxID=544730 RepID=A0A833VJ55_9POAL|nr:putative isoprenylcysteine alpha-carbonyl methylesterase ICMEL2 isoform X1 [Carex littledalei]